MRLAHVKKSCLLVFCSAMLTQLAGCASYDVGTYQPNNIAAYDLKNQISAPIKVGAITMPAAQDKNRIICRLAGDVYLPNKQKYTTYIQNAFVSQLITADRYSSHARHVLSGQLKTVNFSSTSGQWTIAGQMQIDNKRPISITSVTNFGTAFIADSACKDVAENFSVAAQNFVTKTLKNPIVLRQLR